MPTPTAVKLTGPQEQALAVLVLHYDELVRYSNVTDPDPEAPKVYHRATDALIGHGFARRLGTDHVTLTDAGLEWAADQWVTE